MGKKKPKSKSSKSNVLKVPKNSIAGNMSPNANLDVIAAALSSANSVVFMKVCRLCESKDGPFLNIFDTEKITSKKVEELMPFGIAENDGLPHKICFRCSAKVEELYDFIQKCINTQKSLHTAMGKKDPIISKPKTRILWEEKLNKSNMSNDDICDALIKKAMEGIKDIPLNSLSNEEVKSTPNSKKDGKPSNAKKDIRSKTESKKEEDELDMPLKDLKLLNDSKFIPVRTSRSQHSSDSLLDGLPDVKKKKMSSKQIETTADKPQDCASSKSNKSLNDLSFDYNDSNGLNTSKETAKEVKRTKNSKPFDIMDHVSMIKVNGVGVLFQCKLCNRNFLKKDIVMSHGCAKTGVPKVDFTKNLVPPEPPKVPVVKYINTKTDSEFQKQPLVSKFDNVNSAENITKSTQVDSKPKPKIGPASKVRRENEDYKSVIGMTVVPIDVGSSSQSKPATPPPIPPPILPPIPPPIPPSNASLPSVNFPVLPSFNSRYKLIPGPNNTFQLVEETSDNQEPEKPPEQNKNAKSGRKRKSDETKSVETKYRKQNNASKTKTLPEVIDLDEQPEPATNSESQPYPVGLFQTLPHHSVDAPFTTPAMKKQSYTVVQTGNPSKLLISTKPQKAVAEEVPKKRGRKPKLENKPELDDKQPFSVTLEDTNPPKDPGFFTFINVDPLLQPSYVLPTHNIIQESQISTSTPLAKSKVDNKDPYSCNMCGEKFSREKKLLTHIQSHYSKMDEEDQLRAEKTTKKKIGKKH